MSVEVESHPIDAATVAKMSAASKEAMMILIKAASNSDEQFTMVTMMMLRFATAVALTSTIDVEIEDVLDDLLIEAKGNIGNMVVPS